ncbi:MAG: hypothetical protein CMO26_10970 [Thiotrichales bacterium]|nr:hypothetical protein [Thiotrichales bacterium]
MSVAVVDLTQGSLCKHLVRQATPMVFGVAAMMSFALIDTWFVAQGGGTQLAAMSYTFPVVVALTSLGIGLMAGMSSVAARRLGRNDVAGV